MRIVAGIGELGPSSDDPSTNRLNHPTNVAFDPLGPPGELVIAAWHNSRIKRADIATGAVIDICGNGKRGFGGDGGPAEVATLDLPVGVVFDRAGNLLIADQANQMIRRVDRATDVISTIAGIGHCADDVNPDPCQLNDGGPATAAGFHFPIGQSASPGGRIALGADGSIYVADTGNFRLRRIDPAGTITTFAGNGTWGFAGDGGPATDGPARPAGRRGGRRRRQHLHRGHRQQLHPRRDARRDHFDVRRHDAASAVFRGTEGSPPLPSSIAHTGSRWGRGARFTSPTRTTTGFGSSTADCSADHRRHRCDTHAGARCSRASG